MAAWKPGLQEGVVREAVPAHLLRQRSKQPGRTVRHPDSEGVEDDGKAPGGEADRIQDEGKAVLERQADKHQSPTRPTAVLRRQVPLAMVRARPPAARLLPTHPADVSGSQAFAPVLPNP